MFLFTYIIREVIQMKKFFTPLLTVLLALLCAGFALADFFLCQPSDDDPLIGMPNPIHEYDTVRSLEEVVGYTLYVPASVQGFALTDITSIDDMAQLLYSNGAQELCFRVSPISSTHGDNSGDYVDYSSVLADTIRDLSVTTKGSDSSVSLAIWQANGYDYSIGVRPDGVSFDEMTQLICAFIK